MRKLKRPSRKVLNVKIKQKRFDVDLPFNTDWAKGPAMNYYQKLEKKINKMEEITKSVWNNRIKEIFKMEGYTEDAENIIEEGTSLDEYENIHLDEILREHYSDAPMDEIERKLNQLQEKSEALFDDKFINQTANDFVSQTEQYATSQFKNQIQTVAGVNPFLGKSNELNRAFRNHLRENVRLIKTIPQKYHGEVERVIREGMMKGKGIGEITKDIDKAGRKTTNNARLIARDQSGKIMGNMTKLRHKQAGLKKFRWITVGDSRVRPRHQDYSGEVFTWKEGASGEYPGMAIQCRCIAAAVETEIKKKFEQGGETPSDMPENLNNASEEYMNMNPRVRDSFNKDGSFNYAAHRETVESFDTPYDKYNYKMDVTDELLNKKFQTQSLDDISSANFGYKETYQGRGIEFKLQGEVMDLPKDNDIAQWVLKFDDANDLAKQRKIYKDMIDEVSDMANNRSKKTLARLKNEFSRKIQSQKTKNLQLSRGQIDDALKDFSGKDFDPDDLFNKYTTEGRRYANDNFEDGLDWYSKRMRNDMIPDNPPSVEVGKVARSEYVPKNNLIRLRSTSNTKTGVHEMAHAIHKADDETKEMVSTWFARRTDGYKMTKIHGDEYGYKDEFINHYTGKVYGVIEDGEEVVSMGMQHMYNDPVNFYIEDQNHFKMIFSILVGL